VFYFRQSIIMMFVFSTLFMSSCTNPPPPPVPNNTTQTTGIAAGTAAGAAIGAFSGVISAPAAAAVGGIAGGALGHYLAKRDTLYTSLDRDHLQIVKIGEEYMIYLPSDAYFYPNSSHINENFYPALDHVAAFIIQYETSLIKVSGYTDNIGNKTRNLALSRQQAQNIMNYLWRRGLNARMMYSTGYGHEFPIAQNQDEDGRAANRRVQITFRAIPTDKENL
jgi:outer membrane protein OmpA-like peptidoglycan-associated protein